MNKGMRFKRVSKYAAALLLFCITLMSASDLFDSVILKDDGDSTIIQIEGDLIGALDGNFSATLNETDITDVIRMFAVQTGINMIIDPDVSATISAEFSSANIKGAFLAILNMADLYYLEKDGIVKIMMVEEYKAELVRGFLDTRSYDADLIDLDNLSTMITPLLTPGVGSMLIDGQSSRIIISDVEDNFDTIEEMLVEVSIAPRMVEIEARIVQIELNDDNELGIQWDALNLGKEIDLSTVFAPSAGVADEAISIIGSHTFESENITLQAFISALAQEFDATLVAQPKILTANREEAYIHIGSKVPYVSSIIETATTGQTTSSVEFIDVGIMLTVTPVITEDGLVSISVEADNSSYQMESITATENAPKIITTEVDCLTVVRDGETIIIGGLIQTIESEELKSIPFLGKIPILKYLFSHTIVIEERSELAIFITPRILEAGASNISFDNNSEMMIERTGFAEEEE